MRIIGGKYRSRLIQMPKGVTIRPTQDRVREAIFNILGAVCVDARVLDLYSGSGAFGLEAFSRGAKEVIFIDNNIKCIETIKKNAEDLDIRSPFKIFKSDSIKAIAKLAEAGHAFGLIFMDPPYYGKLVEKTLIKINTYDIITTSSIIVAEHFKKDDAPESIGKLHIIKQSVYGDTVVSFYKVKKEGAQL